MCPASAGAPHHQSLHHYRAETDPNGADHLVLITQLREQITALKRQVASKDAMLLGKDRQVSAGAEF